MIVGFTGSIPHNDLDSYDMRSAGVSNVWVASAGSTRGSDKIREHWGSDWRQAGEPNIRA